MVVQSSKIYGYRQAYQGRFSYSSQSWTCIVISRIFPLLFESLEIVLSTIVIILIEQPSSMQVSLRRAFVTKGLSFARIYVFLSGVCPFSTAITTALKAP